MSVSMSKYRYVVVAGITLLGLGTYLGYQLRGPVYRDVTKVEIVERTRDVVQWRTQIVTRTVERRPDGTVTETDRTEQTDGSGRSETDTTSRSIQYIAATTDYSLGVGYRLTPVTTDVADWRRRATLLVGRRLLGDTWLTGSVQPVTREVGIGLSLQW
jgi:hypothetical protein